MSKIIKYILFFVILAGLICFTTGIVINRYVINYSKKDIYNVSQIDQLPDAECAVVLGALVMGDGSLSPVLQDRMDYGILLYKQGKVRKLLLTGDNGEHRYNEVGAMREYAMKAGIPQEDIFLDHAGFSTYESMYRAKEIFLCKKVIVVTQMFHISRAVYDAKRLGMEAVGLNADQHIYGNALYNYLREYIARGKDFFWIEVFRPQPKYLGDQIPISGNGVSTVG